MLAMQCLLHSFRHSLGFHLFERGRFVRRKFSCASALHQQLRVVWRRRHVVGFYVHRRGQFFFDRAFYLALRAAPGDFVANFGFFGCHDFAFNA